MKKKLYSPITYSKRVRYKKKLISRAVYDATSLIAIMTDLIITCKNFDEKEMSIFDSVSHLLYCLSNVKEINNTTKTLTKQLKDNKEIHNQSIKKRYKPIKL